MDSQPRKQRKDGRKRAASAARGLMGGISRLDRKVRRLNKDLASVQATSRLLTGPQDTRAVLDLVVQTIAEAIHADAAALRLLNRETNELQLAATYGLSEAYRNKGPVSAVQSDLNRRILDGKVSVVADMRAHPAFQQYHAEVMREGLVSSMSIPLRYHDEAMGALRLYSKKSRRFSPADIALAQTVAEQSAAAIMNQRLYAEALEGERMARQIRLAGAVQRHLIPQKAPCLPGYDVAGRYVPCFDVGGDFYDFICVDERHVVVAIGDVMGKGVPASLAMASLRSSLRAYAEYVEDVAVLARRVNEMFCEDTGSGEFATLFCARIDRKQHTLTYCNCGHNPPILVRGPKVRELRSGGMILGVGKDTEYEAEQIELRVDDVFVMYTDGLPEARNFGHEEFGMERIVETVQSCRELPAEGAVRHILWTMRKFAGLHRRADDTAVVVIKRVE